MSYKQTSLKIIGLAVIWGMIFTSLANAGTKPWTDNTDFTIPAGQEGNVQVSGGTVSLIQHPAVTIKDDTKTEYDYSSQAGHSGTTGVSVDLSSTRR